MREERLEGWKAYALAPPTMSDHLDHHNEHANVVAGTHKMQEGRTCLPAEEEEEARYTFSISTHFQLACQSPNRHWQGNTEVAGRRHPNFKVKALNNITGQQAAGFL